MSTINCFHYCVWRVFTTDHFYFELLILQTCDIVYVCVLCKSFFSLSFVLLFSLFDWYLYTPGLFTFIHEFCDIHTYCV